MKSIDIQNLAGGILVLAISLPFALEARTLFIEDPELTGPGVLPLTVAIIAAAIGLALCLLSLRRTTHTAVFQPSYRALAAVLAAIVAFTIMIKPFGIMPTFFVVTLVAAFGSRQIVLKHVVPLALFMAVFGWLLFSIVLGMTIPAFRIPL